MNLTDFNIPLIFFVSFILVIWFESDVVQTFANITNTRNFLKIPDFEKYKLEECILSNYPTFLYETRPGYLTKLVSCPICLCFWLTLFSTNILVYTFGYQQWFSLLILPVNYISSLLLYLIIKKLL